MYRPRKHLHHPIEAPKGRGATYFVVDGRNGTSGNYGINVYCSNCGNGVLEYGEDFDDCFPFQG
ncbi:MAG: hypothetical protein PF689_02730 [Deltaproteobacteria bacterium]|nr:hypothetical protein [Deltaproteobacteria bacterium]